MKPIFLVGFMGAGKSFVGKALAAKKKWAFYDMDELIEEKAKRSIKTIFEEEGEQAFRLLEKTIVHECLDKKNAVIATGGGAPCFFDNMDKMNAQGRTIFLNPSIDILVQRLIRESENRPLVAAKKNEDELRAFILDLLSKRLFFYKKAQQMITTIDIKQILALVS